MTRNRAWAGRLACALVFAACTAPGFAQNAAVPPARPLAARLAAKRPVSLMPTDPAAMAFRDVSGLSPAATAVWSGPVLRVESPGRPKYADHVQVKWRFRVPVKKGDVLLVRFLARAEYARQESGEAAFELAVQQQTPVFARHVLLPLTAGPEWSLIEVPFTAASDATPEQGEVNLNFGAIPQAVQIAGFEVLDFGDRAKLAELPQTRFTYKGREAGAAWRKAALERIEKIRTAPLEVRVIDAAGNPIPGARVEARLARPAFLFGTCADADLLLGDTPDAKRYQSTLRSNFDAAVLGNDMKWPRWSGSPENRARAIAATDWLEARGFRMRGHNLVWPGDTFSPKRIVALPPPRGELGTLIKEHIRDILTANKGRIECWDVINEMLHEKDYFKFLPESEAAEWFKVAHEADPRAKLAINEYAMLNSPKSPQTVAEYVALVKKLRATGAPIDVMGVQGHVGRQVRAPEQVLSDLDLLAAAGPEIQITEFDINSPDEELQADYTRDFLIALYSHPAVTGFTMWGFWEGRHWKPDAAMFRTDWTEKPNAKVWRDLVWGQWRTKVDARTGADGRVSARGHLGDYEFTVTAGDKVTKQTRTLTRDGARLTIQVP